MCQVWFGASQVHRGPPTWVRGGGSLRLHFVKVPQKQGVKSYPRLGCVISQACHALHTSGVSGAPDLGIVRFPTQSWIRHMYVSFFTSHRRQTGFPTFWVCFELDVRFSTPRAWVSTCRLCHAFIVSSLCRRLTGIHSDTSWCVCRESVPVHGGQAPGARSLQGGDRRHRTREGRGRHME